MGYYTRYQLQIEPPQTLEFVQSALTSEWTAPWTKWRDHFQPCGGDPTTWREWEQEMRAASKAHPKLLFTLDGEGEESGDIWRAYFRGGLMQLWKLPAPTPEPFDPEKLR